MLLVAGGCQTTSRTASSQGSAMSTTVPGISFLKINASGRTYPYAAYVPRDYDASKPWPLIVFLNGSGECGTDGQRQLTQGLLPAILNKPQEWPFVVLFPQKPDQKSAWEDHSAYVLAIIDAAKQTYNIDASRVYLTGLSQGGHGTWAIGSMYPDRFAALAPICGYGKPDEIGPKLKSMPIWAFHGAMDKVVLPEQSQKLVDAAKAAGGNVTLTLYPGVDHGSWDRAYREENLGRWFLTHQKPAAR